MHFRGVKVLFGVLAFSPLWIRCAQDHSSLRTFALICLAFMTLAVALDMAGLELAESWLQSIDMRYERMSVLDAFSRKRTAAVLEQYRTERRARSLPMMATRMKLLGRMLFLGTAAGGILYVTLGDLLRL